MICMHRSLPTINLKGSHIFLSAERTGVGGLIPHTLGWFLHLSISQVYNEEDQMLQIQVEILSPSLVVTEWLTCAGEIPLSAYD